MASSLVADGNLFMPEYLVQCLCVDPATGCWIWSGPQVRSGGRTPSGGRRKLSEPYGRTSSPKLLRWLERERGLCRPGARSIMAHAAVWVCFHGPPPDDGHDWTLDHDGRRCPRREPLCCNPDHLQLVTRSVNSGRAARSNRHALQGTIFDGDRFDRHGDEATVLLEMAPSLLLVGSRRLAVRARPEVLEHLLAA